MKKILRIAFVFALAGATLMYTGCSKDYSEDIDKLDMEIQSVAGSIQSLQSQVVNALSEAQKALTEAQAAAKAAANAGTAASANADAIKAANAKVAALEARVAALEAAQAKLDEIIEAKIAGKADKSEIEAAIAEIQSIVDAALAQVSGNFSVAAVEKQTATYVWAKWAPETTRDGIKRFNKLVEVFPELADIKQDDTIEMLDNIDFIVNPSSVALDDTYKFYLLGKDGKDSGVVLGNPAQGFATKAGLNIWNVEVQKPAYGEDGKTPMDVSDLALVVENADGIYAQTGFDYTIKAHVDRGSIFQLATHSDPIQVQYKGDDFDGNTIDLARTALETENNTQPWYWWTFVTAYSAPIYKHCYIIEATDAAEIEEFGVSVEGTKVTIKKGPEAGYSSTTLPEINFKVTAIGVNGKTAETTFKLRLTNAPIEANAELATKEVTLGYADGSYKKAVKYNVSDFEFSALEWRTVFNEMKEVSSATLKNSNYTLSANLLFFDADGELITDLQNAQYSEVKALGFYVESDKVAPGTYEVTITDDAIFYGKGELVIKNPDTCPVKLIDALCDDNGVLQIVGTVATKTISYELVKAFVTSKEYSIVNSTFVDMDKENDEDSWVMNKTTFEIPVATNTVNKLYTPRTLSVDFAWFTNTNNKDTFTFEAEAVSPIYVEGGKDVIKVTAPNLYINGNKDKGEPENIKLSDIVSTGLYVAGDNVGKTYKIFNTWSKTAIDTPAVPATYTYYRKNGNFYNAPMITDQENADQSDYKGMGIDALVSGSKYVLDENGDPIEFTSFDTKYLKVLDPTLSVANLTALQNKHAKEGAPKLYLTNAMFNTFARVWAQYYSENCSELSGLSSKGEKAFWYSYETIEDVAPFRDYETWKTAYASNDLATFFPNNVEKQNAVKDILEADKTAVELFNLYAPKTRKLETEGSPAVYTWKNNEDAASEITSVTLGFVDKEYADTFVKYQTEYTPNINSIPEIAAKSDARLAGLNAVELEAYIKISDDRGMTMTLPFKVTVAPATKE